ncbi:Fis family transcriptional regulator [Rhodococcus fascians]|nr:Fis family transcriptional regulator [Rhodococcus fascians]MBY4237972.1 Fis family transcriptional regulator [Rhodococcus fascians]MBY4253277.1 Fis family transcriptional regulator [Rhodococcus fascians]MBY4268914.1 Fis family transcriptional regulator [Rhodococcus fascians]
MSGERDPRQSPVRPAIVQSWKRSILYGLEPNRSRPIFEDTQRVNEQFLAAAGPVIDARRSALMDSSSSLTVTDAHGLVLSRCVEDSRLTRRLDHHDVLPGFSFAETSVGTNSAGMILETGLASMVAGPEHFFEESLQLTCSGAPIYHPTSKRLIGTLNLTCRFEDTSPIMLSWVREVAAEIERALAVVSTRREHLLFEAFLADNRDSRHGVVCLDEHTIISNAAASRLIGSADQPILWEHAAQAISGGRTDRALQLGLANGSTVSVTVSPVQDGTDAVGAVLRVKAPSNRTTDRSEMPIEQLPSIPGLVGRSAQWLRVCTAALEPSAMSLLIVGDEGTGKFSVATAILGADAVVIDALDSESTDRAAWVAKVRDTLASTDKPVILRHLDAIEPSWQRSAVAALASARTRGVRVAATMTDAEQVGVSTPLVEWFDTTVAIPRLSDRTDDLPLLLDSLSARHNRTGRRIRWMADAVQTLGRVDWDRNISSLDALVRELIVSKRREYIGAQDLPADIRVRGARRQLLGLEQAEATAIMNALRDTGGNKRLAADKLGIARSTLYRKVRAFGIDLSAAHF